MSTKIYNGYYIDQRDLLALNKFSMKLRKAIREKQKELYARKLVDLATETYDTRTLIKAGYYKPEEEDEKTRANIAWYVAYSTIEERYQKTQGTLTRDVDYDLTCDVTVIPTKTKILAMVHAEQPEFHKVFENLKGVHKYAYWDGDSDIPDGLTEKEFSDRGKEWDKAMPSGIPSMYGFNIACTQQFLPWIERDVFFMIAPIAPLEERVKEHAKEIVSRRFFKHTIQGDTAPLNEIVPRVSEWIDYMESDDGKKEIETIKEELRAYLKNPLTPEDLFAEPEEIK
ncbi:MAG: hypothetical protein PHW62_00030 [Candidatus Ratteibacteria bacterium]|nr:hypothetical protein [Candidatus Ratteibacteria bacterium]